MGGVASEQRGHGHDSALDLRLGRGGGALPLQHGHPSNSLQELGVRHLWRGRKTKLVNTLLHTSYSEYILSRDYNTTTANNCNTQPSGVFVYLFNLNPGAGRGRPVAVSAAEVVLRSGERLPGLFDSQFVFLLKGIQRRPYRTE